MKNINALVAVALVFGGGNVQAGLINPGFESGNTSGWTKTPLGIGSVVSSSSAASYSLPDGTTIPSYTYKPMEGNYFLKLETGSAAADDWRTLTQAVFLKAGESLSGYAAFDWDDYDPYLDEARVRVLQGSTVIATPFDMIGIPNITPPPDYIDFAYSPWTPWNWTATADGTYTLEYGVANGYDDSFSSIGYFDSVTLVPEPSALTLFVIGLASLTSIKRRKAFSFKS